MRYPKNQENNRKIGNIDDLNTLLSKSVNFDTLGKISYFYIITSTDFYGKTEIKLYNRLKILIRANFAT